MCIIAHISYYFYSFAGEVLALLRQLYRPSSKACISLHQETNPILVKYVLFHYRRFMIQEPPQKQLEMEMGQKQVGSSLLASLATRPLPMQGTPMENLRLLILLCPRHQFQPSLTPRFLKDLAVEVQNQSKQRHIALEAV